MIDVSYDLYDIYIPLLWGHVVTLRDYVNSCGRRAPRRILGAHKLTTEEAPSKILPLPP